MMEKPTCANCKYFVNYLYKKDTHLFPLNIGHCTVRLRNKENRYSPDTYYCIRWEEKGEIKERSLKNILTEMNSRLEELVLILEDKNPRGD